MRNFVPPGDVRHKKKSKQERVEDSTLQSMLRGALASAFSMDWLHVLSCALRFDKCDIRDSKEDDQDCSSMTRTS